MGLDQTVHFPSEKLPAWQQLADLFAGRKYPLQIKMIDGELAFPDEVPTESWRELRVGTPDGMVTLRRAVDGITLVTWGNADAKLLRAWNALAWGLAHLTGGTIGSASLDDFAKSADLPDELRP